MSKKEIVHWHPQGAQSNKCGKTALGMKDWEFPGEVAFFYFIFPYKNSHSATVTLFGIKKLSCTGAP